MQPALHKSCKYFCQKINQSKPEGNPACDLSLYQNVPTNSSSLKDQFFFRKTVTSPSPSETQTCAQVRSPYYAKRARQTSINNLRLSLCINLYMNLVVFRFITTSIFMFPSKDITIKLTTNPPKKAERLNNPKSYEGGWLKHLGWKSQGAKAVSFSGENGWNKSNVYGI